MTHDEVILLLPDYLQGKLEEGSRKPLGAHLAECRDCALAMVTVEILAPVPPRRKEAEVSWHPSSDEIVGFALEDSSLEPILRVRINSHLEECSSCQREVEATRGAEEAVGKLERPVTGLKLSLFRALSIPAWAALAAVLLFGALLYPALLGVWRLPILVREVRELRGSQVFLQEKIEGLEEDLDGFSELAGPVHVAILRTPARGLDPGEAVRVLSGRPLVAVAVELLSFPEGPLESFIRFQVRPEGEEPLWSAEIPASEVRSVLQTTGFVYLLLPASALGEGRNELVVSVQGAGKTELLTSIPFLVEPDR